MKKALLCLFFALGIGGITAQSIQVVSPGDCFAATFNFELDQNRSPDASGRNVFVQSDIPTTNLIIAFNATDNRWEIRADGGTFEVYYINTFASTPNPPDGITSAWEDFGFCDNTGTPVVSGDGTQNILDPCDNDTTPPVITCQDITVELDENGFFNIGTVEFILDNVIVTRDDNCGVADNFPTLGTRTFTCENVGVDNIRSVATKDVNGNTSEFCDYNVTVKSTLSLDMVVPTDESCDGAGDGSIEITASGINSLEYSIDGGANFAPENIFTGLPDGDYEIVVRDVNNPDCQFTTNTTIAAGPVCDLAVSDPCSCLNNATPYDMDAGTGGGDGQFSEVVTISADAPLPAGLNFVVIAPTTGVYDVNNVPAEGAQSAGVPAATDGSVSFTYNNGVYELPFVHNDGEGYSLTVVLQIEGVNAIGFQYSNTCFYPAPVITSVLDGPFCSLSLPVPLEGNAGAASGTGKFYIDGVEATIFDPALFDPGFYTITYEFDAGAALGYQLVNNLAVGPPAGAATLADAQADPGCVASVVKTVEVIPKPIGYACREQVTVSLRENCQAELTPQNLVGNFECVDLETYFDITVEDGDPANGPIVDECGYYRYTLTGPDGLNCGGFVLAEDKQAPALEECPATVSGVQKSYGFQPFLCEEVNSLLFGSPVTYTSDKDGNIDFAGMPASVKAILDITGYAKFTDNCGDLTVRIIDEVEYGPDPDCDDIKIIRTFSATDGCLGLAAPEVCTQEIIFTYPGLENVFCPDNVELACDDEIALDANGNPHPDETGYPWLYTAFGAGGEFAGEFPADLNNTYCSLGASYTDGQRIVVCPGTYQIIRRWEILDWCAQEIRTCEQIIKVGDEEAPAVSCEEIDHDNDGIADLRSYSTGPFDCTSSFQAPMPLVEDNCSEWEVLTEILGYSTSGPVVATILPGQSRFVSGIPLGCHFFRYTVTDACGNKTVIYCPFVVEDRVAPAAVCNGGLNVSIGGDGLARVYADQLDGGSTDNCGPVRIEVRRRILAGADYDCLDIFDYNNNGQVIGDEVKESVQFGDPGAPGNGQFFYYTAWSSFVDFTCCDKSESVRLELRVWDDRNGDGSPGNEIEKTFCEDSSSLVKDNSNVCWLDLSVEDKLPPYCVPPLPASIDCYEVPFDFDSADSDQMTALFGTATGTDNCTEYTVSELTPDTEGLNDCGFGTIVRRFFVRDAEGQTSPNTCEQVITLKEQHDYKIRFPKDAEANCGTPVVDSVTVEELACDLLAVSVNDEFFSASGDECYKILRTYSVINWCEYDGISNPVVVSRDEDCDGKPGDEEVWVIVKTKEEPDPCFDYYGDEQAGYYQHVWYDRDKNPTNLLPIAGTKGVSCDYTTNPFGFWKEVQPVTENQTTDTDSYPATGNQHCNIASTGYWQYTQVIKVYDNIDPEITFTAPEPFCSYSSDTDNDCPAEVSIGFTVDENCTPDDLTIQLSLDMYRDGVTDEDITDLLIGTYPDYQIKGSFPLGIHSVGISVEDGCGNQIGTTIPFEVVDCKAPAPICINGLAIELMPVFPAADVDGDGDPDNGAMDIWASDFVASPVTDCSGEVTYSINVMGEEVDPGQLSITLTCDSDPSLLLEVWAWDELGNGDYCESYVLVQDNMIECDSPNAGGSIAGIITNEDLVTIAGVSVELSGNSPQSMETPDDGHYAFSGLSYNFDYTVTPYLDKIPLNGVSTFDLVLMSKHILGVQYLDSPYKMIAADVNNSKTITTLDAIQLRRLVLNVETKFSNNASWRFIPRAYKFPNPANPWIEPFPEVINVNNLQGPVDEQDFVAIKIGDLNFSAKANALEAVPRSVAGRFLFQVPELAMTSGDSYRIEFRAADLNKIQGYQMTLQLDRASLTIREIEYGIAQPINFGLHQLKEGLITASWNQPAENAGGYASAEVLFSIIVEAQADVLLSDVVKISNRLTAAEAYDLDDQLLDVGIEFGTEGQVKTAGFEVYQNVPNPFRLQTSIGFYLPEASEVTIRVYDANGRTLKLMRGDFAAGKNQVLLSRADLGASGMLYYSVTAGEELLSRKMLVME